MRQPTGSPFLYTLLSVQFFGLPGPKKYVMSPRRIRLPVFFSCAATWRVASASPVTTMAADNAMVSVLRIADLLYVCNCSAIASWDGSTVEPVCTRRSEETGGRVAFPPPESLPDSVVSVILIVSRRRRARFCRLWRDKPGQGLRPHDMRKWRNWQTR